MVSERAGEEIESSKSGFAIVSMQGEFCFMLALVDLIEHF